MTAFGTKTFSQAYYQLREKADDSISTSTRAFWHQQGLKLRQLLERSHLQLVGSGRCKTCIKTCIKTCSKRIKTCIKTCIKKCMEYIVAH